MLARITRGNEILGTAFRRLVDRDPRFEKLSTADRAQLGESILVAFQGYLVVAGTYETARRRIRLAGAILETLFRGR